MVSLLYFNPITTVLGFSYSSPFLTVLDSRKPRIFNKLIFTEAYKGHCVLCKDVLCFFLFQTFDIRVLCSGFCVLCPVLLNGAMETLKGSDKNGDVSILVRVSYFTLLPFLSACPVCDIVFCARMFCVLCFKLLTFKISILAFVFCVLCC